MAVRTDDTTRRESDTEASMGTQRAAIGLNVAMTALLALALVVLVNWFASLRYVRADASTFGGQGLSDRTKAVLSALDGPVRMTTAYLSTDVDKSRDRFISRMMRYGDELAMASKQVVVEHIDNETQKAQLIRRISDTYGSESKAHQDAIKTYNESVRTELEQALRMGGATGGEAWLMQFPVFGSILDVFQDDLKRLTELGEGITKSVSAALPNYAEATGKLKTELPQIQEHLTKSQQALGDIARLAEAVAKADGVIKSLSDAAGEVTGVFKPLRDAVGATSAEPPADAKAALRAFATAAQAAEEQLRTISTRIDTAVREAPMIQSHAAWNVAMDSGMKLGAMALRTQVDPPQLIATVARELRQNRQVLLDIIDRDEPQRHQETLVALRDRVLPGTEQLLAQAADTMTNTAAALGKLDPESQRALEKARGGEMFAATIKSIEGLMTTLNALPELKLGRISEELSGDNIVVIEANAQAKVLPFDQVWPVREQISATGAPSEERPRTFNGDAAIPGAIVSLTSKQPFATVVLATFEVEPPPQARQFMQPQVSSIPGQMLNTLRERLTAANFNVKTWDLTTPDGPPEPEKGTESVFIFLPPAPPNPPNPFMGQQQPPSREFSEAEMKRVTDVLDKGGRGLFLAGWEYRRSMFGFTSPEYAYAPMLAEQWGVAVDNKRRIVEVEPDLRATDAGAFRVIGEKFTYVGLNDFTEHPVGQPLRNSRVLVYNACPVTRAEKVPDGVAVEPVLMAPVGERYVVADINQIITIINAIANPDTGGRVPRAGFESNVAFPVAVAATRKKGEVESRIVVLGTGQGLVDEYISKPVIRSTEKGLFSDQPPLNNADLAVNAIHWLQGQEKWIAAGPITAPAIRAIDPPTMAGVRLVVWAIFPALATLGPGALMWMKRRK